MIAYAAFAFYADIGKLSSTSLRIDYLTIPLIVLTMTAAILLLALRFHRYLNVLDIKISFKKSILIYITGLSLTVTPGSSGQILKSQIMKKQFGYAISRTSPIVLIEKWNELCASLLILAIFSLIETFLESIFIIIIGTAITVFLLSVMRYRNMFNSLKKIILKFPRLKTLEESIENSQDTLNVLSSKKVTVQAIIYAVPALIFQAASVYFVFHALGINITFVLSTQIFYVALISGILSFLPAGLGVTEGSMAALLLKYYDHHLAAVAGAVLFVRLITLWYPTFLGMIVGQFFMKHKKVPAI
jgi:glycosyltransferase 2 family protein